MPRTATAKVTLDQIADALQLSTISDTARRQGYALLRLKALGLADYCSRCGGGGQYSFNGTHSRCYKCNGTGHQLPKLTPALLAEVTTKMAAGALDSYFESQRQRSIANRSREIVLQAWTDTGIGKMYDWRSDAPRDLAIKAINFKMSDAEHEVYLAAGAYNFLPKATTDAERDAAASALAALVAKALQTIAEASAELAPYR